MVGQGAFGKVFAVKFKKDGEIYALKVLKKDNLVFDSYAQQDILEEGFILRKLTHPLIIKTHAYFGYSSFSYILMELVRGRNLKSMILQQKKLSTSNAIKICGQVVIALEYIHSQNIVYGDLKPDNILITDDGIIKIVDFGSAREVDDAGNCKRYDNETKGTLDFQAPEFFNSSQG